MGHNYGLNTLMVLVVCVVIGTCIRYLTVNCKEPLMKHPTDDQFYELYLKYRDKGDIGFVFMLAEIKELYRSLNQ